MTSDSYIDSTDPIKPIKYYPYDKYYRRLTLDTEYETNFFVKEVRLKQNYLFQETDIGSYKYGREQDFVHVRSRDGNRPLWRGFLRLDPVVNTVTRESYSLETFFSEIGGLAKTISFVCGTLALAITRKTFMLDIL